ncbi:pre-peptidase C-terminal domain-containing protein [Polaromonas sp. YR568]|uniref:pre-peptidase C-terminal domain-containing protein n=1 Tax=Polaromonas sp. YR568 TaxID=1855301 RepID=UPI003137F55D
MTLAYREDIAAIQAVNSFEIPTIRVADENDNGAVYGNQIGDDDDTGFVSEAMPPPRFVSDEASQRVGLGRLLLATPQDYAITATAVPAATPQEYAFSATAAPEATPQEYAFSEAAAPEATPQEYAFSEAASPAASPQDASRNESAAQSPSVDIDGSTATSATLAVNGSASSRIGVPRDEDWFSISLTQGTTYTFNQNAANGSRLDTWLRLLDANGNTVGSNDDFHNTLNSQITYTATTSGTYYLSAEAFGLTMGDYTLSASAVI